MRHPFTCRNVQPLLPSLLWEDAGRDRARLDAHVARCPDCRVDLAELRAARAEAGRLRDLPSPSGMARRAVEEWQGTRRVFPYRAVLCGAVAVVIAAVMFPFRAKEQSVSPSATELGAPLIAGVIGGVMPSDKPRNGQGQGWRPAPSKPAPAPAPAAALEKPADDLDYLDGWDPGLAREWAADEGQPASFWIGRPLPRIRDDFVHVPIPLLADGGGAAAAALREYKREAEIVDTRLFREVTLRVKALSLPELCEQLRTQTGVTLRAARGVEDENVTVFVKARPAREVMRQVARLFGYRWLRSGEEGKYRYELSQDLRSQLAEEEMRSRDFHAALVSLDERMRAYDRFTRLPPEELARRVMSANLAQGEARTLLGKLSGANWGGVYLYPRLGAAERALLAAGQELRVVPNGPEALRLPVEWVRPLLTSSRLFFSMGSEPGTFQAAPEAVLRDRGLEPTGAADWPGARAEISLKINRSELGVVSLESGAAVIVPVNGAELPVRTRQTVLSARSPSASAARNAEANKAVAVDPVFKKIVRITPKHTCAAEAKDEPHLVTADFWEAVHDASGMPVVADAYSRRFPAPEVPAGSAPLFTVLCRGADALGLRWRNDGEYLLARSTSYFWDKRKEAARRDLRKWAEERRRDGLPLGSLLDMALLSDEQLDSEVVGKLVRGCWGIDEWSVLSRRAAPRLADPAPVRRYARFLTTLTDEQLRAATSAGLGSQALSAQQQTALTSLLVQDGQSALVRPGLSLHLQYAPANGFLWLPVVSTSADGEAAERWPVVTGATRGEALAKASKLNASALESDLIRCPGVLSLDFRLPSGVHWRIGGPDLAVIPRP
jgi:hypothetical protein